MRADLSKLSSAAEPKKGADGQKYWLVVFAIEILFGLTEFKARMKWVEDVRAHLFRIQNESTDTFFTVIRARPDSEGT